MDNIVLLLSHTTLNSTVASNSSSSSDLYPHHYDEDGIECDSCGWIAALGAMIAFGTFGVPIKSEAAKRVNVDPLVFQSYKTIMCFLTSWLILWYGEEFSFTPWGFVSGLFWVPGGIATVYGVKNAGLATAIGVISSCIVLVSFIWGLLVFHEHLHSLHQSCGAVACLMVGLFGMAYYSSPKEQQGDEQEQQQTELSNDLEAISDCEQPLLTAVKAPTDDENGHNKTTERRSSSPVSSTGTPTEDSLSTEENISNNLNACHHHDFHYHMLELEHDGGDHDIDNNTRENQNQQANVSSSSEYVTICGKKVSRRMAGILSAMFSGLYGGSVLAPMKLCNDPNTEGTHFLISFAIGAMTVCIMVWILRYILNVIHFMGSSSFESESSSNHNVLAKAYYALPSFHICNGMLLPGCTSGILWSIGNFCSLICVQYLGEGVGYSATQTFMLVSGLWGIFYFREVTGTAVIIKWFFSAFLTLCGILILSYEHHEK